MDDYKVYIPGFLEYLGKSKKNFVLSVYKGCEINRKAYMYKGEISANFPICIFGPLNQEYNVGKAITKPRAVSIMGTCSGSFRIFEDQFVKITNRILWKFPLIFYFSRKFCVEMFNFPPKINNFQTF